jgi:hypothetical protein
LHSFIETTLFWKWVVFPFSDEQDMKDPYTGSKMEILLHHLKMEIKPISETL